jgi:hypothetical protein
MLHPRPFYYLENFSAALGWLQGRYRDLLDETEHGFISRFLELPCEPAALLVRMIGRKGDLFRIAKLNYPEIGCLHSAAAPLIEIGWLDQRPMLSCAELARFSHTSELQLDWCPEVTGVFYRLRVRGLCERFRLLFFGDFDQDWSQFVLADLGIFKYEKVPLAAAARAFQRREHLEVFCALYACRQLLEEGTGIEGVLRQLPAPVSDNEWLEARRQRLLFQIAQCCERRKELELALRIYSECRHPGSSLRRVRMMERLGHCEEALQLAGRIREQPADEAEAQQVARMWPRLQRKAGLTASRNRAAAGWPEFQLVLPVCERPARLEEATGAALSQADAPVHYVENGLIHSLFGLLCWDAIFAPVAGAFFHEFQARPADLHAPDFRARRRELFARCLGQLDSDEYASTIRHNFEHKVGIQSPFVSWGVMSQPLLDLALECLPREHLEACFERILANIRANASGLPDLVQFWPAERRYRLIEVKGPGDRLQDNQTRWLTFCLAHGIPVSVCYVSWTTPQLPSAAQ